MNQKAQAGPIAFIIGIGLFIAFWAVLGTSFVGKWFNWGVSRNNLTGVEAFLMNNINLWIFIFLIIGVFAWFRWNQ